MKTQGVYYVAPGRVELREFDLADPAIDEVQIEVKASGLCAWDLALFKGDTGGLAHPFLHGHEGAGIVTKVGSRVKHVKVGDKVTAMGDDSQLLGHYANVPMNRVAPIPADATDFSRWIAEPVSCIVNGLSWSKIEAADRIAVVGTGFMGLMFVQGLRYSLAQEVIAIDVNPARLELALQSGADRAINATTDEGEKALAELEQNPLDLTIECAGSQPALDIAYHILRRGGRLNLFSWHRGAPRSVDLSLWHGRGFQVYVSSPSIAEDFERLFARTVPLMAKGVFDLEPLVTHVAPPEEAQSLYEVAVAKSDGYIKGVIAW